MSDSFDPADYKRFKSNEILNDNTGFDPQEFSQFKDLTTHASLLDKAQEVAQQAAKAATGGAQANQPLSPTSSNPALSAFQAAMQTLQSPGRIVASTSAGANELGNTVAEQGFGPAPLFTSLASKVSGLPIGQATALSHNPALTAAQALGTQVASDPMTFLGGSSEAGKLAGSAIDDTAKMGVNKILAPAGEILSGTKQRTIKALFNDPMGTLTAMSPKEAGGLLGDVYKTLNNGQGLTEDEMRQIAKAGDRGTGGSQSVYDDVLQKIKDYAADPENADMPTMGDLIAGRRAASKLSTIRKGMEGYQTVKDLNTFEDHMNALDPEGTTKILAALKEVSKAKNLSAFMNLFPMNANTSANALRGSSMLASPLLGALLGHGSAEGVALGTLAAIAHSPIATGVGTLAARGAYDVGRGALTNPLTLGALASSPLQSVQQNLPQQNQQQ